MTRIISKLVCPKCGGEEFLKGPEGGLAVNIKCAKCSYFMNIAPLPDGRFWIVNEDDDKK